MLSQCTSPEDWRAAGDNIPPGPVSGVNVTNINGGAIISYNLPNDNDILGAKAVYSLTEGGEILERYASNDTSKTVNTIKLEGYGDTNEYAVTIYAIDKSGNISTGYPTTIQPLTPPIILMRQSLQVKTAFGGVQLAWDNAQRDNMGLYFFVRDSVDHTKWVLYDTYFSNDPNGKVVFRGMDIKEKNVKVEMFDRWSNHALPFDTVITPMLEMRLQGRENGVDIWKLYGAEERREGSDEYTWRDRGDSRSDPRESEIDASFRLIHDGILSGSSYWNPGWNNQLGDYFPEGSGRVPFPFCYTIDMGRKAIYSRIVYGSRLRSPSYSASVPIHFEIWGCNETKPLDSDRMVNLAYWTEWEAAGGTGAWKNDWTKIATCKLVLSSGESKYTEGMALSQEDLDRYNNGYHYDMDNTIDAFRYLRFVIYETNTNALDTAVSEISFYGIYAD